MTELEQAAHDAWMAFKSGFKKGYEKGQQEPKPLGDVNAV